MRGERPNVQVRNLAALGPTPHARGAALGPLRRVEALGTNPAGAGSSCLLER